MGSRLTTSQALNSYKGCVAHNMNDNDTSLEF
jgi:hypothetical protein